jgi:hypothetical protein
MQWATRFAHHEEADIRVPIRFFPTFFAAADGGNV